VNNEETIFAEALRHGSALQRSTYLDTACAGNAELRQAVEALLSAHDHAGGILETPPVALHFTTQDTPAAEVIGTMVGPYKLLQQIGEGGMAVVFLAEQSRPIQRKVALKIIKPGMDSRQVIARFEAERQALALMDHANIARVLEAGTTPGGQPYFVMELVKGVPITKYCDEHHLALRARLELFMQVCSAVQHAHQKGIIHRDLKPSNVLVAQYDGRPVPKVIDFGIAKATGQPLTERTLFTTFGSVVGTPEYMSPEQAQFNQLDVDTRSDIYSLGVLMYELLTGSTPVEHNRFKAVALLEMLRVVREEDPPKPSTRLSTMQGLPSVAANRGLEPKKLSALVRGELDWIVMKALEKDRTRRYETSSDLARDIERHLLNEAVQACPPSAPYRLRKFVRRHKKSVLTAAVVLLALVGGVIGTSWGMVRAELAKRSAEEQRDEKDKARQLAEANEKRALEARDAERVALKGEAAQRQRAQENLKLATTVLDEIILKDARQRVTLYSDDRKKGLVTNPEREKVERALLEKGLGFYEQLAQTNAMDWSARRERAKAFSNIGWIQLQYKNVAEAGKAYRQAIELMEKLAEERPEDFDNRFNLASDHISYLPTLETTPLPRGEVLARRAIALFDRLAADFPERSSLIREHTAYSYQNLAHLLKNAKPREAQATMNQALAIWSALTREYPESAVYRHAFARDYGSLAMLHTSQNRFAEADAAYESARAIFEKLVVDFKQPQLRSDFAGMWLTWAFSCLANGRLAEAEKLFRKAAIEHEILLADFPQEKRWAIHELGYIWFFLGELLDQSGNRQLEAEAAYRQSVAYHEKQLAQDPEDSAFQQRLAWSYRGLGRVLRQTSRPVEASQVDAKRFELVKKFAPTLTVAGEINSAAWSLCIDPDPDLQCARVAVQLARKAVELEPTIGSFWNTLGTAQYRAGNWPAAIEALRKASELYEGRAFSHDAFFLAMSHWQLGDKERARKWYGVALVWMEKQARTNAELIRFRTEAASLLDLSQALSPEQEQVKADELKFWMLVLELEPRAGWAYGSRGSVYAERAQWEQAAADFAKAIELNGDAPLSRYRQALIRLRAADLTGYRQLCAEMLASVDPAAKRDSAKWPVWTCVLGPDAVADWIVPLRLAEQAVADSPNDYQALNYHGAVLYRAGQFQQAIARLTEADAAIKLDDQKSFEPAYNWLFLAMAHHRIGHVEEARTWHDKAVQWIDRQMQKKPEELSATKPLRWNRRVTLELLRRETDELLGHN